MTQKNKKRIKQMLCRIPGILQAVSYKTRFVPRIFMYHRFTEDIISTGPVVSAASFEWQLQRLQGKWNVITLEKYVQLRRCNADVPPYTVILTVDDGYRDFYDVAYPLLLKYGSPATFFVTTDFVEGNFWLWHDRLHYTLDQTLVSSQSLQLDEKRIDLRTSTSQEKNATWQILSDYCVNAPDEKKWSLIKQVEALLKVEVPLKPPQDFAAVSWNQLSEMVEHGIEVGGHTVTHPVLSQVKNDQLYDEIVRPREILEENTGQPVATFCYPNGRDEDITTNVLDIVQQNGWLGAVQSSGFDFSNLYRLPRMGITNNKVDFVWKLSGLEQMLLQRSFHRNSTR